MLLANDRMGQTRAPESTGERGTCPGCGARVDSAVGEIVTPHWRHFAQADCDSWAGGETDWHLGWKLEALQAGYRVEVPFGPPLHRADAVSPRGHVIEFQHSGLNRDELDERTEFYAGHGPLTWVFDGVGPWRRRWFNWQKRGEYPMAMLVLDEGERLWVLDPTKERPHTVTRAAVLTARVQVASMHLWSMDTPCATCGSAPTHSYSDGSPGHRFCLHNPIYESVTA
jgi:hypothetical protein